MGKRIFDFIFALLGLGFCSVVILLCWMIASIETRSNGVFVQRRIGRHGAIIRVFKIKTMFNTTGSRSAVTAENVSQITRSGRFFRAYKLDELPQLFNVLIGTMSFVGPRPDVPGYADKLQGEDRVILTVRPGITGPASIRYKDEEILLSQVENPKDYNDRVIWPDKVRINRTYVQTMSLRTDLKLIFCTIFG